MKVEWPLKASLMRRPTVFKEVYTPYREYYEDVIRVSQMKYPFSDNEVQGFKVLIRYYQRYYPQHCI